MKFESIMSKMHWKMSKMNDGVRRRQRNAVNADELKPLANCNILKNKQKPKGEQHSYKFIGIFFILHESCPALGKN